MSKDWFPRTSNVVPLRPGERRRLYQQLGMRSPGGGIGAGTVTVVMTAAVCAGLAVGLGPWSSEGQSAPSADIQWSETQAVPQAMAIDPVDAEWAGRASGEDLPRQPRIGSGASADERGGGNAPVGASFGFCHSGGGTNCVVDGDTFYLDGQKIRIADIDAPETHDYGCASELERGREATRRLQDLLNSGAVRLASIDRDTDRFGRKLRIVEVNGAGVGAILVGEGLARWYAGGRRSWC